MEMLGLYSNRPRGDILYIFKIIFTFLQNNFWNPCYPYLNITSLYLQNAHLTEGLKEYIPLFKQYG